MIFKKKIRHFLNSENCIFNEDFDSIDKVIIKKKLLKIIIQPLWKYKKICTL